MSRNHGIIAVLFWCLCFGAHAADSPAVLRVAACDLPGGRFSLNDIAAAIAEAAPDVVLLQGVQSWEMCNSLVSRIKSEKFSVITCSAFVQGSNNGLKEVAILSRHPGLQAWTQRIDTNMPTGGFAFAVLQVDGHRWGLFSLQLGRAKLSPGIKEAVDGQIAISRAWSANAPNSYFLVTSRYPNQTKPRLALLEAFEAQGFVGAEADGLDRFAGSFSLRSNSVARTTLAGTNGLLMYFDLKVSPIQPGESAQPPTTQLAGSPPKASLPETVAKVSDAPARGATPVGSAPSTNSGSPLSPKVTPQNRLVSAASNVPTVTVVPAGVTGNTPAKPGLVWWIGSVAASLLVFVMLGTFLRGRYRRRQLPVANVSVPENGAYIVVSPHSTTASGDRVHVPTQSSTRTDAGRSPQVPMRTPMESFGPAEKRGFLEWLKAEFVRRLVQDRGALIESQSGAARAAELASERLERLEAKIQEQNNLYNKRIELLAQELTATRQENKALIRMRIAQLKSDMEEARAKIMREG